MSEPAPLLHLVQDVEYVIPAQRPATVAEIAETGRRLRAASDVALERAVVRLRLNGGTWADIGRALGMSRQAATKRYRPALMQSGPIAIVREANGRVHIWSDYLGEELSHPDDRLSALCAARAEVVALAGQVSA